MTRPAKAIAYLVEKARRQHNEACVQLARTTRAIHQALETKKTLEQFAADGVTARRTQTGVSVDSKALRVASGFSFSLDKAVHSQKQSVHELQIAQRANSDALAATLRHVQVMERLSENLHRVERQAEDLAEQRRTDEHRVRVLGGQNHRFTTAREL